MGKTIITGKNVGLGKQNYAALRENECFYVDKIGFIKEWQALREPRKSQCSRSSMTLMLSQQHRKNTAQASDSQKMSCLCSLHTPYLPYRNCIFITL